MMTKRWNKQEIQYLKENYSSTRWQELNKHLQRSRKAIRDCARLLGITKTKEFRLDMNRIYDIKHDYFDNINTEAKAYWLGFLFADGCVYNNQTIIHLQMGDLGHLTKLKDEISPNTSIKHIKITNSVRLVFSSVSLSERLKQLGMETKDRIPNIENDLKHHFIRGLFDGDGCIYFHDRRNTREYHWSLVGEKPILEWVKEEFGIASIKGGCVFYRDGIYNLQYGGNRQVEGIKNYLYNNANIYLKRKWEKFTGKQANKIVP